MWKREKRNPDTKKYIKGSLLSNNHFQNNVAEDDWFNLDQPIPSDEFPSRASRRNLYHKIGIFVVVASLEEQKWFLVQRNGVWSYEDSEKALENTYWWD